MLKLSIIVPVYNIEKQLADCLDSLVNQTYKDIEIIAVNDASTDNSRNILQNYADYHHSIHIIDMKNNSGPGIARNCGIRAATGSYIGFVDGDDWVDLNFYEALLSSIQEEACDIAIASISDEYNNATSSVFRYIYNQDITIDGKTALKLLTKSCNLGLFITPIMNNKIYRTNFLKQYNIQCCDNRSWQDDFFSYFAILYANKVRMVSGPQYHYRQRISSITHTATSVNEKIDNCIDVLLKIKTELFVRNLYETHQQEYNSFVERCISSLLVMLRNTPHDNNSDDLIYLFNKIASKFDMSKIISYLDNERIYKFFNL